MLNSQPANQRVPPIDASFMLSSYRACTLFPLTIGSVSGNSLVSMYDAGMDFYKACSLRVNGGYSSVVSKTAYAKTLNDHRITPTTKSNSPFG